MIIPKRFYMTIEKSLKTFGQLTGFYPTESQLELRKRRAEKYFETGKNLCERNYLEEAVNNFTQAIEKDPKNLKYLKFRASAYHELGAFEKSEENYGILSKLDSKNKSAHLDMVALNLGIKGNHGQAIIIFEIANSIEKYQIEQGIIKERPKSLRQEAIKYFETGIEWVDEGSILPVGKNVRIKEE